MNPNGNKQPDTDSAELKTRLFDTVAASPSPDEADKKAEHGKETRKKVLNAVGKTAKYSGKTVLFIVRKVLTYTLNVLLTLLIIGTIVAAAVALAFMVYLGNYVNSDFPELDSLKYDSSLTTSIYYVNEDGAEVELEDDRLSSSENRMWVAYNDIPQQLVKAYIAIEDMRFWEHNGVDTKRTLAAVYNFFIPSGSSYGGSTITQQLIKNVSGNNEETIQRKVQEIFRALNVDKKYSKTEILEMYLNTIYLSENCYGVRAAALEYFGKELSELTLNECAAIASIGKWPIHYDPLVNPQNNLERRNLVLREMLRQELITESEYYEAYDAPLQLSDEDSGGVYTEYVHSYYIDAVIDDVIEDLMIEYGYTESVASLMLYSGGLHITTCLDPEIQSILEEVFVNEKYWPKTTGLKAQAAMCIMDQKSGDLLAIVGGRGEKKISRGLNRATHSKRQCGSSIKPISLYAYALETGLYNYAGPCDDIPYLYDEKEKTFWPNNATNRYDGASSLENAIQRSLNTVAINTCNRLGVARVFNNLVNSGFKSIVSSYTSSSGVTFSDQALSPLSLGSFTFGVTVREMTQAYACLANSGVTSKARTYTKVTDSMGNILLDNEESHSVLYSESTAFMITRLLQTVVSGPYGTARRYCTFFNNYEGLEIAAKTGTTNDNKDLYFCGYTPDLVAACWYGYDNNKTITSASSSCGELWNTVFDHIYSYFEKNDIPYTKTFPVPGSVGYAENTGLKICLISGKLATEACENDIAYITGNSDSVVTSNFYYLKTEPPTEYCDKHILVPWDTKTKAICMPGCTCPESDIQLVGFRLKTKQERCFKGNLRISDSQYIYIEVPDDYVYPSSREVAFFRNLYSKEKDAKEYPGYTGGVDEPYNRICLEHFTGATDATTPVNPPPVIPDPPVAESSEPPPESSSAESPDPAGESSEETEEPSEPGPVSEPVSEEPSEVPVVSESSADSGQEETDEPDQP